MQVYMCIYTYTYTQFVVSSKTSPPSFSLATNRTNLFTHTFHLHACQHSKLRTLTEPHGAVYTPLSESPSLIPFQFLKCFHCDPWTPFHWVKGKELLPFLFKHSLCLLVLAETWIYPEDVTSASNFLKWQLFSLPNWVMPLGWEEGQVSLLLMVPFRPFSLLSPRSEFCSHHLYHLLLFLLQSSARIRSRCYWKISSSWVTLSLSAYNSEQFQYPGRGSFQYLVS